MSTQPLDPSFARAIILHVSFRGDDHHRICAALLLIALQGLEFDAGMIPAEVCGESKTALGIATGALLSMGLIEVCGRVRSSSVKANGRKVNALRLVAGKMETAKSLLKRWGYAATPEAQLSMAI